LGRGIDAMPLTYLDQNALIKIGSKALGSSEFRAKLDADGKRHSCFASLFVEKALRLVTKAACTNEMHVQTGTPLDSQIAAELPC
jgi:hypothetical protein